jgi:hypothetical protein
MLIFNLRLFAQMLVMPTINPLRTFVDRVNQYPSWPISKLMMCVFRYKVKLADTTSLEVLFTDRKTASYRLKKSLSKKHLGSLHATAIVLLAELCTGLIVLRQITFD